MFFCLWVCFCLSGRNTNSLEAKETQKAPIPQEFCGTWCAEDRPEIPYEECAKLPKAESTVCILNQSTCHITWKCKSLNCIIWLSIDCSAVSVCFTVVITTYEKHMLINHVKIRSMYILLSNLKCSVENLNLCGKCCAFYQILLDSSMNPMNNCMYDRMNNLCDSRLVWVMTSVTHDLCDLWLVWLMTCVIFMTCVTHNLCD